MISKLGATSHSAAASDCRNFAMPPASLCTGTTALRSLGPLRTPRRNGATTTLSDGDNAFAMYEPPQASGLTAEVELTSRWPLATSPAPVATPSQRALGDTIAQRTFKASPRCVLL